MNFSAWAIRNPVAPLLAMGLLLFLGLQAFKDMPVTRFPNIDVPVVAVTVAQSGAAPAELEMQVTKKIEDAIASVTGVDELNSTVTDGISTTSVLFRMEVSPDEALRDVKDGGILKVLATDPGSVADMKSFCEMTGNRLVSSEQDGDVFIYHIEKTGA